jgi:transposase
MDAMTIAVDLAKNVFEVAVADAKGRVQSRRRLSRTQFATFLRTQPPAHVVMEACGTSHHWGRTAQACGHRVSLLPPHYVRPFVRRQKTDRTDVTGLLDAQRSDRLHPVPVKTVGQQGLLSLHRIRSQWIATRTARINLLHGLLAEYGICFIKSTKRVVAIVAPLLEADGPLPAHVRRLLGDVLAEIRELTTRIATAERELEIVADDDPVITRLQTIPGIKLLTSTALVGTVGHIHSFRRARRFASWLGLTPREDSSGERRRLGAITKQGDVYLRSLITHGARAVLAAAQRTAERERPLTALQQWAVGVARRRGGNRATIALANKLARIVWAVWSRDEDYRARPMVA